MNPLFPAHIIADFLLQPSALVAWKMKRIAGIVAHAAVHAAVLALFLVPLLTHKEVVAAILIIASLHGLIDYAKIQFQKAGRGTFLQNFLLDQLAHFLVLAVATFAVNFDMPLWKSEMGIGILSLLFFFSFIFALWNLGAVRARLPAGRQAANMQKTESPRTRFGLIVLVFLLFFIPATAALAFSSCFFP